MAIVLPARGPSDSECDSESKGTSALRISDLHRRNAAGDLAINFIHIPKNAGTSIRALCGRELVYNNHATDVKDDQIQRQLVILRHPVERFVSAFYYSMEYYRHTRHIRDLVYHYMVTPNRIIEAVRDPHHPHHMKVIAMMNNDGSQKLVRTRHLIVGFTHRSTTTFISRSSFCCSKTCNRSGLYSPNTTASPSEIFHTRITQGNVI